MKIVGGPLRDLAEEKEADVLNVRQSRRQRGASMVELGLVLFILLLLVAAIADFGRVFNHYVVINNASREGARYASRRPPGSGFDPADYKRSILDAVKQETTGSSVSLEDGDIEIDPDPVDEAPAEPSNPITVTVNYNVPTIIADIAGFGELPLRARTTMVVQGADPSGS